MKKLEYQVSFTTPAFLGNAEQQAQWRAPPFKALLRQWWRVAKAKECGYDYRKLLERENTLFGQAADEGATKSQLRLRLSSWAAGLQDRWPEKEPKEKHPEVQFPVGTELYLGYGPLAYDRQSRGAVLNQVKSIKGLKRTAITPEKESAALHLGYPEACDHELGQAIQLAAWFGTVGSRSRNGWGSLMMFPVNGSQRIDAIAVSQLAPYTRALSDCLTLDWPHAIGKDDRGPAVWRTRSFKGQDVWRQAMQELARIKIAFRTQFKFSTGKQGSMFEDRHVLAYPVTNHPVPQWGQARLANQVRFKVLKEGEHYVGVIVHLPCRIPDVLEQMASVTQQLVVWQAVHAKLDELLPEGRLK